MNDFENNHNYNFSLRTFTKAAPAAFHIHFHFFYEILYFLDGDITITLSDVSFRPKKHDLFFIPPNTYHLTLPNQDESLYSRYVLQFDTLPDMTPERKARFQDCFAVNVGSSPQIKDWFRRFDRYYSTLSQEDFGLFDRAMISELLFLLDAEEKQDLSSETPLFSFIIDYIDDNFIQIQSVDEIANAAFISSSYLFYLFKNRLKMSPKQYLQKKKMTHAKILLNQGISPSNVHHLVGIPEYSTFYRLYVKYFGISPSREYAD